MQTRYWIQWRPIPGKPWVLVDSRTEQVVRNAKGFAVRFDTPESACARAERLVKAEDARAKLITYPVTRRDGRVVNVTIPND